MIKKIITKFSDSPKLFITLGVIILLLLADVTLYVLDLFWGAEKGVIFTYRVTDLIINSNLLIIITLLIVYILSVLISNFKSIKKIMQNLAISLIAVVILLSVLELVFYCIIKFSYNPYPYAYDYHDGTLFRSDSILGFGINKNVAAQYSKIFVDPAKPNAPTSYIFNTTIRTDSLGNRAINIPDMQTRNKYALFFGCSFTFGLGVEDTQTIPYLFAKGDSNFCTYNFAVTGYGPQNALSQLQYQNIPKSVKQDSGICFYIYMHDHPARVIGTMKIYTTFGRDLPYYDYKDGDLHRYGLFSTDRWFISSFYTLMSKSNVLKYFNVTFPPHLSDRDYKLTCDILYKSYLEYKRQFHNDNFYVIIYPNSQNILPYLKSYNLKILDFSNLFAHVDQSKYLIPYDGHPTALANEVFSRELIKTLKKLNIKY